MATEAQRLATYHEIIRDCRFRDPVTIEMVDRDTPGWATKGGDCSTNRCGEPIIRLKRGMAEVLEQDTFAHEVAHAALGHPAELHRGASVARIEAEANDLGDRLLARWRWIGYFDEW